jgi:integrase
MARAKLWSKKIKAHDVEVHIFERTAGGSLYMGRKGARVESKKSGVKYTTKIIKAIDPATTDRKFAEKVAKEWATEVATDLIAGRPATGPLTLGRLVADYEALVLHRKSAIRQQSVRTALRMLSRRLGTGFRVTDFGKHQVETYVEDRKAGRLRPDHHRAKHGGVRAGTIRNELHAFRTVCAWAAGYRTNGTALLSNDPFRDPAVRRAIPVELNDLRPVATPDRYQRLAAVADQVDSTGKLALIIDIAWHTGHRINAILHLRASDILLDRAVLADDEMTREWSGGIRWRAEWDKKRHESKSPLPAALLASLPSYIRKHGVIGDGWLFPHRAGEPVNKARADYLLRLAEKAAGLPRQERGGWHAFRRGWATVRKHMPAQDVAFAGGWRDLGALQKSYQRADSATSQSVVDLAI